MINRDKIIRDLKTEKQELEKIIKEADYRIKNAPEGAARISEHGKGVQFFHRKHPSDKTGVYIPVSKRETAIKLIQKKSIPILQFLECRIGEKCIMSISD